ncbi:hypothetical protein P8Q88_10790 [Qipengyuania sp. XHP0207]|uniref:hypothetical protein n=1 Tax=Qipengyuania sp. XHP0207 TaxID=3038078 RepID=UPI00241F5801|nr:hypothetical protein [Qipengyuania sp. XHP0207]MDG5748663.1 hypothetical protein [Qipengyuania sp. XHP0207]
MTIEEEAHRRTRARLNLGIEAKLIGLGSPVSVLLQDISATGAKIVVPTRDKLRQGVLCWNGFEAFGDIVWQDKEWCGMKFDQPISEKWLFETRRSIPALLDEMRNGARKDAAEFVAGRRA